MKLDSVREIAAALNKAKVRYLVVGGLAVAAHGYGRLTYDVDLVIKLEEHNIIEAFRSLGKLGYQPRVPVTAEQFADPSLRKQWIEEKGMRVLNLFSDRYRETPIDIFVYEPFDYEATSMAATTEDLSDNLPVKFVDIRTLIKLKENTGRAKDLDDIEHLRKILDDETG